MCVVTISSKLVVSFCERSFSIVLKTFTKTYLYSVKFRKTRHWLKSQSSVAFNSSVSVAFNSDLLSNIHDPKGNNLLFSIIELTKDYRHAMPYQPSQISTSTFYSSLLSSFSTLQLVWKSVWMVDRGGLSQCCVTWLTSQIRHSFTPSHFPVLEAFNLILWDWHQNVLW